MWVCENAIMPNKVKVVIGYITTNLPLVLSLNSSEFPDSWVSVQFAIFINMLDMLTDIGFAGIK